MEKESLVLCDTNILIDFYKAEPNVVSSLKTIGRDAIAVSIINYFWGVDFWSSKQKRTIKNKKRYSAFKGFEYR